MERNDIQTPTNIYFNSNAGMNPHPNFNLKG